MIARFVTASQRERGSRGRPRSAGRSSRADGGRAGDAALRLLGGSLATGSAHPSHDFSLSAGQALRISDLARTIIGASRDSFGDLRDMLVDVEVLSGSGRVVPFVQSIDNTSGDAIVRVE
ncbi:MAG TPA: hypothetical protein VMT00_01325 [Thermoanaerobaculia bacterium]|nr:hypothetical protein [Thermoanaerobaculia bacterium]